MKYGDALIKEDIPLQRDGVPAGVDETAVREVLAEKEIAYEELKGHIEEDGKWSAVLQLLNKPAAKALAKLHGTSGSNCSWCIEFLSFSSDLSHTLEQMSASSSPNDDNAENGGEHDDASEHHEEDATTKDQPETPEFQDKLSYPVL